MSYDDDYRNPGYPGGRAPSPDLTDEAQWHGLDPRQGDEHVDRRTLNHPWGKVVKLEKDGDSVTLVQTESYPRPFPWAIQARFSMDGVTFTPEVPAGWGGDGALFQFTKSFDIKTGPAPETFDVFPGNTLPICALIARALSISVKMHGESAPPLWVQFVVCPTQQIDCAELIGPSADGGPTRSQIIRVPPQDFPDDAAIIAPGIQVLPANLKRRGLIIQNHAETNMYVAFNNEDSGAAPPSDDQPLWTILLPPSVDVGLLGVSNVMIDTNVWRGKVWCVFDDADGDPPPGYAFFTEME